MKNLKHRVILSCALLIGLALDIITKLLTVNNIPYGQKIVVWDNVLELTYRLNSGAAFSFLESSPWIFVVMSSLVSLLLIYILYSEKVTDRIAFYSLGAVLCGGLGNLIDRFVRGAVVDMIDCRLFKIPQISFSPISVTFTDFAIFNVADCFVTCGTILFLLIFIIRKGEVIQWYSPSAKTNKISDSTNSSPDIRN